MTELRYYTAEHEWVESRARSEEGGAIVRVGITDVATGALGDIVFVSPPDVGAVLTRGEVCGEVESTKSVSEIYAPLSGEVVALNANLAEAPETINSDPFGAGWLFDLRLDLAPGAGLETLVAGAGLLSETAYRELAG